MLAAVNRGAEVWRRLRIGGGELALAFGALLLAGTLALVLTPWLRALLAPEAMHVLTFVAAPLVTASAALLYRLAIHGLDEFIGVPIASDAGAPWPALPVVECLLLTCIGVLGAVGGSFVLSHLMVWVGFPIEEQPGILAVIEDAKRSGDWGRLGVLAVAAVALAPWAEEWLFRGLLFRRIAGQTHPLDAFLISGVAFALIHDNVSGFVIYLWLGSVFAFTYWRTGRLWTSIVVHAVNNALALAGLVFLEA